MQAFYSDHFVLPLPPGHRFPMQKYARLRERVAGELPDVALTEALPADDLMLTRVHARDYVARVSRGELNPKEQREIGFPWSPQMVERSRRSAGATVAACRAALVQGVAVNLAGGTHHACADRGEGFCVFNDAAVAARAIQTELGPGTRIAIVDLDVHQGNGTAAIFEHDPSVFTLSLHGEHNYPFRKARSDLDVALPDGCGDEDYLVALGHALTDLFAQFTPALVIYLAGADPLENDRLGRLALTHDGLLARDRCVLTACAERALPVAIAMAGGYARDIEQTVSAHFATVRLASQFHQAGRRTYGVPAAPSTPTAQPAQPSGALV
ncbi:histone deacetylase family protein [Pandoraea pulmonicola]|uniref:Histone deacetylase-like amidohydrolase n=1 Tax=Pandoraea pulmonicola TaxID=93221 RepID=A0AAJ5CYX7_PANPU|nr:histone deacetylase [Pandoraea pulmonicola]SUA89002.1 Histone deacetylase-like amidohydrolase [Pandoraea pulmonicola]